MSGNEGEFKIQKRTLPNAIDYILSHSEKYSLEVRGTLLGLKNLIEDAEKEFPILEYTKISSVGTGRINLEDVDKVNRWFVKWFGSKKVKNSYGCVE